MASKEEAELESMAYHAYSIHCEYLRIQNVQPWETMSERHRDCWLTVAEAVISDLKEFIRHDHA